MTCKSDLLHFGVAALSLPPLLLFHALNFGSPENGIPSMVNCYLLSFNYSKLVITHVLCVSLLSTSPSIEDVDCQISIAAHTPLGLR